jgi:hypothetical protein
MMIKSGNKANDQANQIFSPHRRLLLLSSSVEFILFMHLLSHKDDQ